MSKKKLILIIAVIVLVGIFLIYYFMNYYGQGGSNGNGGLNSLFPFTGVTNNNGVGGHTPPQRNNGGGETASSTSNGVYNPLIQISTRPIIGMTVLAPYQSLNNQVFGTSTNLGGFNVVPMVRFIEHGTGYVYDVSARGQNETQKTGTTIVRAVEAYFGDNGNSVILRYLKNDNKTIETFLGQINAIAATQSGSLGTIKGDFLPENITDLAMFPNGQDFSYLVPIDNGTAGISLNVDRSNKTTLFTSHFDEWLLDANPNGLGVTTKPSNDVPGYSYIVLPSGIFQRVLGGIDGLTTKLSPNEKEILYSASNGNTLGLFIKGLTDATSIKTGLMTLPEKCVWNKTSTFIYCAVPSYLPNDIYPDSWYQGVEHFSDNLYKINATTGEYTFLANMQNNNIDATNLQLDYNERFLLFINKNDGTPWSYDLMPPTINQNSASSTSH